MGNGLRAVIHSLADDEAVAASDRARLQRLTASEKDRIIKRDLATWIEPNAQLSWQEKKAVLWDRSMGRCHYCQKEMNPFSEFTVDHVVARILGGSEELENLVACCRDCNSKKKDSDIGEWWKRVNR